MPCVLCKHRSLLTETVPRSSSLNQLAGHPYISLPIEILFPPTILFCILCHVLSPADMNLPMSLMWLNMWTLLIYFCTMPFSPINACKYNLLSPWFWKLLSCLNTSDGVPPFSILIIWLLCITICFLNWVFITWAVQAISPTWVLGVLNEDHKEGDPQLPTTFIPSCFIPSFY